MDLEELIKLSSTRIGQEVAMSKYSFHRMSQYVPPLFLFLLVAIASLVLQGGVALNILTSTNGLNKTQYLNESDYRLVLQGDCDLVTYQRSQALWRTNTSGRGTDCSLQMQTDGNLVLYNSSSYIPSNALWASNPFGPSLRHYYLVLKSNGNLSIYDFGKSKAIWDNHLPVSSLASSPRPNLTFMLDPHLAWRPLLPLDGFSYMPVGYYLSEGLSLQSESSKFNLTLEHGCNLRSKDENGRILWETHTNGTGPQRYCQLILQQDGNLQIRTGHSDVIWESKAIGNSSVNWALYVDGKTGNVSVGDILQPDDILWTNASSSKRKKRFSVTGLVVGVIGGCFLIVITALALIYHAFASGTKSAERELRQRLQNTGGKSDAMALAKIRRATKNFQTKIGKGGFGEVFYGRLADGQEVAVKVLSATSQQSKEEFFNEIELLSVVHHKSLVSLVGYCVARKQLILVYEYMSGGDLRGRLYGEIATNNLLSWNQRKDIILQVAEGIEYLHDKCYPAIIHRDIKSNNILLSEKVVAKVADFGLSKLRAIEQEGFTHITTLVRGTPGYLDPEYQESGKLTEKSDVYAFGVVLMEILTGHYHLSLVHIVSQAWRLNQLDAIADMNLNGIYNKQEFSNIAKLSLWCTTRRSSDRPSMPQVVQTLREIGLAQVGPLQYEAKGDNESLHTQMAYAFESPKSDENDKSDLPILWSFSGSYSSTSSSVSLPHQARGNDLTPAFPSNATYTTNMVAR